MATQRASSDCRVPSLWPTAGRINGHPSCCRPMTGNSNRPRNRLAVGKHLSPFQNARGFAQASGPERICLDGTGKLTSIGQRIPSPRCLMRRPCVPKTQRHAVAIPDNGERQSDAD